MSYELGRSRTIPEAPGQSRTGRVLQGTSGSVGCLGLAHWSWGSWSKSVRRCGLPCTCSPGLGALVEEGHVVWASLDLLTRDGGLGRRASGGVGCLKLAHQCWGSWSKSVRRCWLPWTCSPELGVLVEERQAVLAALYLLTGARGRDQKGSGGVGCLVLVDFTSPGCLVTRQVE